MARDTVESMRERLLAQFVRNAETITHTNGYWNDLSTNQISREWKRIAQISQAEQPFLLILTGVESTARSVMGGAIDEAEIEVSLLGFMYSKDPEALDRELERFLKDARKMVLADLSLIEAVTGSQLAENIKVASVRTDGGVVGFPGWGVFEVLLDVTYRYAHTS